MILKRRIPLSVKRKIKEALWPTIGFKRLLSYYKHRIARLPGTPEFIAKGFASGVAISFTPFLGFHILTGGLISWFIEGSLLAMVIGTLVGGNPWTYPFIWVGTYELGQFMLGHENSTKAEGVLTNHSFTLSSMMQKPMELLVPMTLGSIPLGILAWFATYYMVVEVVKKGKKARHARIHRRK